MPEMISNHLRNPGHIVKISTLPFFLICLLPSQTIWDVYHFQFLLVRRVWDSWETVKSLNNVIVWDFPDISRLYGEDNEVTKYIVL